MVSKQIFFAVFVLGTAFISHNALGEVVRKNIYSLTSISHAYNARSLFTNPAALGFQSALNGSSFDSSLAFRSNRSSADEFSLGIAYGVLGAGYERLSSGNTQFNRFSFGIGTKVHPWVYTGIRYRVTNSGNTSLSGFNSFDFGLQYRRSQFWSLGVLAETVNQPTVGGTLIPSRLVAGATVRPISWLELSIDASTPFNNFANSITYEGIVSLKPIEGFAIRSSYHKNFQWQVGFQASFGLSSLFGFAQTHSGNRGLVLGTDMSTRPFASVFKPSTTMRVDVPPNLREEGLAGGLLTKDRPSLLDLTRALKRAEEKEHIRSVLVRIESFPLGLAAAEEVYESLSRLRNKGKAVIVSLGNAGVREYLIASAADEISMEPGSELRLWGLKESSYFLKGTFDKLGIKGELFAKGKYKSAPEMFLRTSPSVPAKEAARARLTRAQNLLTEKLSQSRKTKGKEWNKIFDQALFGADQAKQKGLIDSVLPFSLLKKRLEKRTVLRPSIRRQKDQLALKPRITVLVASGDILQDRGGLLSFSGREQITTRRMEKKFKWALSDPLTKAVVFRISSGGGEILPSRQIAAIVEEVGAKKPVYVSMGDVAASGGYMIAAPARKIFASPSTLTGSIGVFLGKFDLSGFYKKIGVSKSILMTNTNGDLFSEHKSLSENGRRILRKRLDQHYLDFTSFVSKHRKLELSSVEASAQGRVWLGTTAKQKKLVDETLGLMRAVEFAAKERGLSEGSYDTFELRGRASLLGPLGGNGWLANLSQELPEISQELLEQLHWAQRTSDSAALYLSPVKSMK